MAVMPVNRILLGDCRERLRELPERCVHTIVTSPPYWGLRDYGIEPTIWGGEPACEHDWGEMQPGHHPGQVEQTKWKTAEAAGKGQTAKSGQFCQKCGSWRGTYGLEPTVEMFLQHSVEVFRAVWRVLRDDGTLWLNLGDTYSSSGGRTSDHGPNAQCGNTLRGVTPSEHSGPRNMADLSPKQLVGIPWRVAFALQADGWYLRQDIIWYKPNPMPDSVSDRCTKAHDYLFLLTKSPRYYYDAEAVKEDVTGNAHPRGHGQNPKRAQGIPGMMKSNPTLTANELVDNRNKRSVWTVPVAPFKGAHFATFPPDLIRPCIRAGTSEKGACPQCRAPWVRVVDRRRIRTRPGRDSKAYDRRTGELLEGEPEKPWRDRIEVGHRDPGRHVTKTQTLGWLPGCGCYGVPSFVPLPECPEDAVAPEPCEQCDGEGRMDQGELFGATAERWSTCPRCRGRGTTGYGNAVWKSWNRECDKVMAVNVEHLALAEKRSTENVPCVVLDPFGGAGTTGLVAAQERRDWILIEANPEYCAMAQRRTDDVMKLPLFGSPHGPDD